MCSIIAEKLEDLPVASSSIEGLDPSGKASLEVQAEALFNHEVIKDDYRDSLKTLILGYADKSINRDFTMKAGSETITLAYYASFVQGMRQVAGLPGTDPMIHNDHEKWIRLTVLNEFGYFMDFLEDIRYKRHTKSGKMPLETRIELYVNSLDSVFDAGRLAALGSFPRMIVTWVLDPAFENCESCQYLASISPMTADNLPVAPRDGQTLCRQNCKCVVTSKKTNAAKYNKLLETQPSREEIIATLEALMESK